MNNIKDIQELSFVFVNTFYLHIIEGVQRDVNTSLFFNPYLKPLFFQAFDCLELVHENWVGRNGRQMIKLAHVANPLANTVTQSIRDQVRKLSVAAVNPASRSYTISLVLDLARVEFVEFLEESGLEQI